jgi:ketosteroid isomerase-like protein
MSDWVDDYFADVDAMRLDPYVERHTEDAVVSFNNNPPAQGKDEIRAAIGGFWELIDGMQHDVRNRFDDGDTVILESDVHYTRKDGQVVTVKTASVIHRDGELVDRLTFYNDPAAIFA